MLLIIASLVFISFTAMTVSAGSNHSSIEYRKVIFVNSLISTYYITALNSAGKSQPSNEAQATPVTIPEFSSFLVVIIAMLTLLARRRK